LKRVVRQGSGKQLGIANQIDVASCEAIQTDKLRILLCAWCAEKGPRVRQGRCAMPSHVAQGGEELADRGMLHIIARHCEFRFAHPAARIAHDTLHMTHSASAKAQGSKPKGMQQM
jgi:hypothetical protein